MSNWLLRWIASGVALAIVANIHFGNYTLGITYDSITALALATIVIGLVNSLIRPVLTLLTLPLNCLTFGLFGFILNAVLFFLAANSVKGFHVEPLGALPGVILMGLISSLLNFALVDRVAGKKD